MISFELSDLSYHRKLLSNAGSPTGRPYWAGLSSWGKVVANDAMTPCDRGFQLDNDHWPESSAIFCNHLRRGEGSADYAIQDISTAATARF